jgi:hypothetical protein
MREERSGKLVWDDQSKRGEDWWTQQNVARAKIRQLLRTEDNGFDLTGYDIGTTRSIRDYEKYAGIHFKKRSIQKYTSENKFPPNPVIDDDTEWEESFMHSFYHLVTIHRHEFPDDDYKHILVAFDDADGIGLNHRYIVGHELKKFMTAGTPIHYEEMFLTDKTPSKVVFWAFSESRGWLTRIEHSI